MIEIRIIIPVADNNGIRFTDSHNAKFEVRLVEVFGGFTRLPGETTGGWIDGGVIYADNGVIYVVAVAGLVSGSVKVIEITTYAKAHYSQLAIYVSYLGQSEVL